MPSKSRLLLFSLLLPILLVLGSKLFDRCVVLTSRYWAPLQLITSALFRFARPRRCAAVGGLLPDGRNEGNYLFLDCHAFAMDSSLLTEE